MSSQNNHQNIISSLDFLRDVVNRRLEIFFAKEENPEMEYPKLTILPDNATTGHL